MFCSKLVPIWQNAYRNYVSFFFVLFFFFLSLNIQHGKFTFSTHNFDTVGVRRQRRRRSGARFFYIYIYRYIYLREWGSLDAWRRPRGVQRSFTRLCNHVRSLHHSYNLAATITWKSETLTWTTMSIYLFFCVYVH